MTKFQFNCFSRLSAALKRPEGMASAPPPPVRLESSLEMNILNLKIFKQQNRRPLFDDFSNRNTCFGSSLYDIISRDYVNKYTYLQNKRMRWCGVPPPPPPPPPPIIFERLKLPQQIIYRRKENLSESPNHQKHWENILVSRFYEQFSRNRRNLGHCRKFKKISSS